MNRRFLLQLGLSLALGGLFAFLAMRGWRWGDIVDSLAPLQGRAAWLTLDPAPPAGSLLTLERDGARLATLTADGEPALALPARLQPWAGSWRVLQGEQPLANWAIDLRSPAERRARRAAEERARAAEGARGSAVAHHDPWLFAALGPESKAQVKEVQWVWLWPYVLVFLCVHIVRILRWGVLLQPLGHLRWRRLLTVGSVGFMAILLLPLRLGEFVRPYLVARESDIRMTSALATCVVERVVDGLVVTLTFFVVLALLPRSTVPPGLLLGGYVSLGVFLGALLSLVAMHWQRRRTLALLDATLGRLAPGLGRKIAGMLDSFIDGLRALPSAGAFGRFVAATLVYWALNGFGFWIMFRATGATLPSGQLPGLLESYACMTILAIGIIIPGGPGFAGNFELSLGLALGLFLAPGVLATRGAVFILLLHALQFVLQVLVGFGFLVGGGVSLQGAVEGSREAASEGAIPSP